MKVKILPWMIPWTPVILWMAVIFLFSHQPATESSELSSGITKTIADIITSTAPEIKLNQESLHFFIRKCEYCLRIRPLMHTFRPMNATQ